MARSTAAAEARPAPSAEPRVIQARESVDELKLELIGLIREKIERNGWNQNTASRVLGTWQSKISLIMSGKVGSGDQAPSASLESLLASAALVGVNVRLETSPAFIADNYPDPNDLSEIPETLHNGRRPGAVTNTVSAATTERAVALMDESRGVRRSRKVHHSLLANLVFLTKYPGDVLDADHLETLEATTRRVTESAGVDLIEFDGESDHVRVLVNFPPNVAVSRLVNMIKDETTRALADEHPEVVDHYYNGTHLWSGAYYASTGGTSVPTRRAH